MNSRLTRENFSCTTAAWSQARSGSSYRQSLLTCVVAILDGSMLAFGALIPREAKGTCPKSSSHPSRRASYRHLA